MSRNKRSAVGLKSGKPVDNSGPVLRRPTPPATAGRTPEACSFLPPQPKSWPLCGAPSPAGAEREAPAPLLDQTAVEQLISFFRMLDEWDREEAQESSRALKNPVGPARVAGTV
jgi:hypothetical protein